MTDYTDLIERLRDKVFKRCGPTMEAVHTKTDEWKAADALEAQARRIAELEFRIGRLKRCLSIYLMPEHADEINKEW